MRRWVPFLASAGLLNGCRASTPSDGIPTIKFAINGVQGGKQSGGVSWALDMIPQVEDTLKRAGTPVHLQLLQDGATDESFKAKMVLDLFSGTGADIFSFDGFWNAEMASANLLLPLDPFLAAWPDWKQYLATPRTMGLYQGHTYVLPFNTDVRGIYYRKDLFERAGLAVDWHPQNWNDIFAAGEQLKARLPGIIPVQWYGGTASGEATTMQGFYPPLLGAGGRLYDPDHDQWIVDSPAIRRTLAFYRTLYLDKQLCDRRMQLDPRSTEKAFEAFRDGRIGIYPESTYLWLGVIAPGGPWGISNRNDVVGWTPMPGGGEPGDPEWVSISGGGGLIINEHTPHPDLAWAVMRELASVKSQSFKQTLDPVLPVRQDLLDAPAFQQDPELAREVKQALPYSVFRPALPVYPRISELVQQMTEHCIQGMPVDECIEHFRHDVTIRVGADHVQSVR